SSQRCETGARVSRACERRGVQTDRPPLATGRAPRYNGLVPAPSTRTPFFGALPERGVWSAVGLTRGQFLAILGVSIALFLFTGGPLWAHLRDGHLARIGVSYGVIPPAAALALHRNGSVRWPLVLGASAVVALVKLVLTAGLLVVLAMAR